MFAKITVSFSLVLVLISTCESGHQKFVEVPFDDGKSEQNLQHSTLQPTQTFHPSFIGASLNEQTQTSHATSNRFRPQLSGREQEKSRSSLLSSRFQDVSRSTSQGRQGLESPAVNQVNGFIRHSPVTTTSPLPAVRNFLAHDNFATRQPVQSFHSREQASLKPERPSSFGTSSQLNSQQLSSGIKPKSSFQPATTFLSAEEPILRFTNIPAEISNQPSGEPSSTSFLPQARPAIRAQVPEARLAVEPDFSQRQRQQISQHQLALARTQPDTTTSPRFLVIPRAQDSPTRARPILNLQNRNEEELEEEIFHQQAENARYSFASQIDDTISGNQHQREEVRDGVNVQGMYSYSDGYVKRTVFYEADDKGFRITKEEEEPLGDGPRVNPNGQANVSSYVSGNAVQYSITAADIQNDQNEPTQEKRLRF